MATIIVPPTYERGLCGGSTSALFKTDAGENLQIKVTSDGNATVSQDGKVIEKLPPCKENHVQYIKDIVSNWE